MVESGGGWGFAASPRTVAQTGLLVRRVDSLCRSGEAPPQGVESGSNFPPACHTGNMNEQVTQKV
jgi:hypothetical protein